MGDDDNWVDVQHKELLDALIQIADAIKEDRKSVV